MHLLTKQNKIKLLSASPLFNSYIIKRLHELKKKKNVIHSYHINWQLPLNYQFKNEEKTKTVIVTGLFYQKPSKMQSAKSAGE